MLFLPVITVRRIFVDTFHQHVNHVYVRVYARRNWL